MTLRPIIHPEAIPEGFSLSQSFRRKAVAHLVVDIQDLYCNPAHPYAIDTGNDISRHKALSHKMNDFVSRSRETLPPTWIVHGVKYIGKSSRYGLMFGDAGRNDARGFGLASLYNQTVLDSEAVVWKSGRDAFKKTDLLTMLHEKRIEAVIVSGLELNACVKETALSASREFPTYILEDLVANAMDDDEALYASIDALKPHCGSLTSKHLMSLDLA